jgi:hypothetical protein
MTAVFDHDGKDGSFTVTEDVSRSNALRFSRRAGNDRVFVTILGPRGGARAVVELTPGMVSEIVQALVKEEMHLTVDAIERMREEAGPYEPA